jgi:hypothetical protein
MSTMFRHVAIKFWTRSAFNTTYKINRRLFFTRRSRNSFLSAI